MNNNNNNNNNTHHDNFGLESEEYRVILYIDLRRMTHNNDGSDDIVSAAELFPLDEKGSGNNFSFSYGMFKQLKVLFLFLLVLI